MAELDPRALIPGGIIYTSAAPELNGAPPVAWYFTGWVTASGVTIPEGMSLADQAVLRALCLEVVNALDGVEDD